MALRPCLGCRRPTDTGNRCPACQSSHTAARDSRRPSTAARGYGADHQRERADWDVFVQAGEVTCRRFPFGLCVADSPTLRPGEPWHLGHPDAACAAPKAPEHVVCNAGAPRRA